MIRLNKDLNWIPKEKKKHKESGWSSTNFQSWLEKTTWEILVDGCNPDTGVSSAQTQCPPPACVHSFCVWLSNCAPWGLLVFLGLHRHRGVPEGGVPSSAISPEFSTPDPEPPWLTLITMIGACTCLHAVKYVRVFGNTHTHTHTCSREVEGEEELRNHYYGSFPLASFKSFSKEPPAIQSSAP